VRYVTLVANLTEYLAYASGGNDRMRLRAARFVDRILASPDIEVIDGDRGLFDAGLKLYRERLDKTYSHVDCMAMVICKRRKITEVLTGDRDFAREGLTVLL
jgi:predicted nucleic acid-binding protein